MKLLVFLLATTTLAIAQNLLFYRFPIYPYQVPLYHFDYPTTQEQVGDTSYTEPNSADNRPIEKFIQSFNETAAVQARNLHSNHGGVQARSQYIDGINAFSRTIVLFTTITTTITSRVLCIPNTHFKNAEAAANICRKRRNLDFKSLDFEEWMPISPSHSRIAEASVMPSWDSFQEQKTLDKPLTLLSSKDDAGEVSNVDGHIIAKRFFLNRFIVPKISTTYASVTTIIRKTIKPAATSAVLCRPVGVDVC